MALETVADSQPKTDEECKAEIDRMAIEIRAMLDESGRRLERASHVGHENRRLIAELKQRLSCGND